MGNVGKKSAGQLSGELTRYAQSQPPAKSRKSDSEVDAGAVAVVEQPQRDPRPATLMKDYVRQFRLRTSGHIVTDAGAVAPAN